MFRFFSWVRPFRANLETDVDEIHQIRYAEQVKQGILPRKVGWENQDLRSMDKTERVEQSINVDNIS